MSNLTNLRETLLREGVLRILDFNILWETNSKKLVVSPTRIWKKLIIETKYGERSPASLECTLGRSTLEWRIYIVPIDPKLSVSDLSKCFGLKSRHRDEVKLDDIMGVIDRTFFAFVDNINSIADAPLTVEDDIISLMED